MLPRLIDPENEHVYVWSDSAYSGECFEDLLSFDGFESLIHEKGARNHPLSDAANELNHVKSAIRAALSMFFHHEHVNGRKAYKKDWPQKKKHSGASRILLSMFFGTSNVPLALLRLHKTWQVTNSLHLNLIKKVTQGFLPSRLCAAFLCVCVLSTHPDLFEVTLNECLSTTGNHVLHR